MNRLPFGQLARQVCAFFTPRCRQDVREKYRGPNLGPRYFFPEPNSFGLPKCRFCRLKRSGCLGGLSRKPVRLSPLGEGGTTFAWSEEVDRPLGGPLTQGQQGGLEKGEVSRMNPASTRPSGNAKPVEAPAVPPAVQFGLSSPWVKTSKTDTDPPAPPPVWTRYIDSRLKQFCTR